MGKEQSAGLAQKSEKSWKTGALWIVATVLIALVLMPLFDLIWRDRTAEHTRQECEVIAEALLKQSINDEKSVSAWMLNMRQANCDMNALAAWAYIYAGIDEEGIRNLYDSGADIPDGLALLQGDDYHVLLGEFPKEEFDEALEARDNLSEQWHYSVNSREYTEEQGGFLEGNSALTVDGENWYYSAMLMHSDAVVISRIPFDGLNQTDQQDDILAFIDGDMPDDDVAIVLVQTAGNKVLRAKGISGVAEGDILEAEAGQAGRLKIGETWYVSGAADSSGYRVYALVPAASVSARSVLSPLLPALMFAALFLLTILYAWFLKFDIQRGRVEQEKRVQSGQDLFGMLLRRVRLVFFLLAVCMLAMLVVGVSLFVVDDTRVWGSRVLSDIEEYFQEDDENAEFVSLAEETTQILFADRIATILSDVPGQVENDAILDLSSAIRESILVVQEDGKVQASSLGQYDLSALSDPDSKWAPLKSVLEGKADHISAIVQMNGSYCQCWATRRNDVGGMLLLLDDVSDHVSLAEYYADYHVPSGLFLIAVNTQTGEILSSSEETYYGVKAESIGLTETVCGDGFVGDIMLDGRRCFVQTRAQEGRASLIAADLSYLALLYLPVLLETIAAGLLLVIVMFFLVYCFQKKTWTNLEAGQMPAGSVYGVGTDGTLKRGKETKAEREQRKEAQKEAQQEEEEREENASYYRERGGELHADRGAVGRWLDLKTPFRAKSADEKIHFLIQIALSVLCVFGFVLYEYRSLEGIMGSTIAYLLQRSWRIGINVYAIAYAILVVFAIYIVTLLIRKLIMLVGENMGSRGETIARLIDSFVGYVAVIGAILYCLMCLGVDAMAIIASAGIVGLGISIGAKDLVADILAGIAIVFEGEFRTGDIVQIGDFRGKVEEIGVRTTKVMSMGNVKVFRNSEVSGVINLTQRFSVAQAKIHVSRSEPIEKVEAIFRKALPGIRKKIPEALDEIVLCGIDQSDPLFVLLLFQTKCREADRVTVERVLSRELLVIMEKENLGSSGLWKGQ